MEDTPRILRKIYNGKQVFLLEDLSPPIAKHVKFPSAFLGSIAVQITADQDKIAPWEKEPSSQLDWYLLMESVEGVLYARGDKRKWELPCVYQGCRSTCCPFIAHVERSEWEDLHNYLGTFKMRWLLLNCIIFVQVGLKVHMQICGPIIKSYLDLAYPLPYKTSKTTTTNPSKRKSDDDLNTQAIKRCKNQEGHRPSLELVPCKNSLAIPQSNNGFPSASTCSLVPAFKKIRLCSQEGVWSKPIEVQKVNSTQAHVAAAIPCQSNVLTNILGATQFDQVQPMKGSSTNTILPTFKKIRVHRRTLEGDVEYVSDPTGVASQQLLGKIQGKNPDDFGDNPLENRQFKKGAKGRRRAKKAAAQVPDTRRAFDGTILIPHDDIFYAHSGWTHFPIGHPLMRNSHREVFQAILSTDVGSSFPDQIQLEHMGNLIQTLWEQHKKCRYKRILNKVLSSCSSYCHRSSFVDQDLVYCFIRLILVTVIPHSLLGSALNWRIFLGNVRRYISASRGRSFTLSDLMQSLKTNHCYWMRHLSSLPLQISLLARLIKWLFVQYIKPLIRQHFYVTETSFGRYRVFFYHKDTWQSMRSKMMRGICSGTDHHPTPVLEKIISIPDTGLVSQFLLHAKLRFIPKQGKGWRPIMPTSAPSIPLKLFHDARLLLQTISSHYREGMDAKASSEFHRKWVDFLNRRSSHVPVYFVRADVEDAFGSILHDRLIEILFQYKEDLPPVMSVRNMTYITPCGRRSKNFRFIPFLNPVDQWIQRLPPNCLLLDVGVSEKFVVEQLLYLTIRSIREVHIKHNNDHFVLKRGIPQGSRLSSSLCHIYYGHMVRQHLSEFMDQPDDLLIRVVDDFLYITSNYDRAQRFHARIHQGFPDYNAHVNITKSTTNIPLISGPPLNKPAWPSFCGLQFNTRTLELRGNYSKYQGTDIIHCISSPARTPGLLLLKRLQAVSTLKLEGMYLDSAINRKPTVVRTLYNASLMSSFRFHAIVKHIFNPRAPVRRKGKTNIKFLLRTIEEFCHKMVLHVKHLGRRNQARIVVTAREVRWICLEAFSRKLARHRPKYTELLVAITKLRSECEASLKSGSRDRLSCWIGNRLPRPFRQMKDTCKVTKI